MKNPKNAGTKDLAPLHPQNLFQIYLNPNPNCLAVGKRATPLHPSFQPHRPWPGWCFCRANPSSRVVSITLRLRSASGAMVHIRYYPEVLPRSPAIKRDSDGAVGEWSNIAPSLYLSLSTSVNSASTTSSSFLGPSAPGCAPAFCS